MSELLLHGHKIESVFELIGIKENDVSFSLGWALTNSPAFLDKFIRLIVSHRINRDLSNAQIRLQHYERFKRATITDLEIEIPGEIFLIVEAKRGWVFPSEEQLLSYANRPTFKTNPAKIKKIVALTECSQEYAEAHFEFEEIDDVPVEALSWKEVFDSAQRAYSNGTNREKRIILELSTYFRRIMTMQNNESNLVYVVSLSSAKVPEWDISWIDIVNKKHNYFHPVGGGKGGWPVTPPNYIAFRYNGQLQSIHKVESYTVFTDPHLHIPEIPSHNWDPMYLYNLGPAFTPSNQVRTGNIYASGRVWCALDTLFTANTISEARNVTKERMGWS